MADQANATDFPASVISAVETGSIAIPNHYVTKVSEWMQLDRLEVLQLATLSRFKPKKSGLEDGPDDLRAILKKAAGRDEAAR